MQEFHAEHQAGLGHGEIVKLHGAGAPSRRILQIPAGFGDGLVERQAGEEVASRRVIEGNAKIGPAQIERIGEDFAGYRDDLKIQNC